MKRLLAGIAAVTILVSASPAFAQHRDDPRDNHDHGGPAMRHAPPPRHYAPPHHYAPPPRRHVYREGQIYNGHRLTYRSGHWGYYQPRNGAQIFINIPL